MDFKTFYRGLDAPQRDAFAKKIGTTLGYCHQLAAGTKHIELGLADAIVGASGGKVKLTDLPLTDRAKFQNKARGWGGKSERRPRPQQASETAKEGT